MSGDHNRYCSGNQPDIVQRLREQGIKHPQQIVDWRNEAADEIERLRKELDELVAALTRAERKLSAYVGVCTGDKELTGTVLPMARTALAKLGADKTG